MRLTARVRECGLKVQRREYTTRTRGSVVSPLRQRRVEIGREEVTGRTTLGAPVIRSTWIGYISPYAAGELLGYFAGCTLDIQMP